jgi:hypothetical protein
MRSIGKALSIVIAIALSWSMTAPAQAQSKKAVAAKKAPKSKPKSKAQVIPTNTPSSDDETGYAYSFQDDPLYGTNGAANAARIHVRKQGPRNTLLRPRLHFIPELLKSVENL